METKQVNFLGSRPEYQEYSNKDVSLIEQKTINPSFTLFSNDYIEYFIYDNANTLLASNYTAHSYTPVDVDSTSNSTNTLQLNPEEDIARFGIDRGNVNVTYNFYTNLFSSSFDERFWIADISENRTELRVVRNDISNQALQNAFTEYQQTVFALPYYPDFLLNFGDNVSLIGVNLLFASSSQQASLFVKLYEPLPDDIDVKDTFWMVHKLAEPVSFNVDIKLPEEIATSSFSLRGPNFNVAVSSKLGQTSDLYNYNTLFGIGLTSGSATTSSFNKMKSLLQEKSIDINVDYSQFENFVHFSSATERLNNFVYKLSLIEEQQAKLTASSSIQGSVMSSSLITAQNTINNIIEKFDEYEYYLYYSTSPRAWPKYYDTASFSYYPQSITSSQFNNGTVTSSVEWLGSTTNADSSGSNMLFSASLYDNGNPDYLINTLPQYIRDDAENNPAFLFTSMLGQHFDNLYVYYKDITNRYNASNDINVGISKDLVADSLRALGISLYTNSNNADNFYYSILGINPDGNTEAASFPTGSEKYQTNVNMPFLASGSSAEDIQNEYYKRIYHNLPYLLKTKGTERGLRALISCFGIPETILRINEFGGVGQETSAGAESVKNYYTGIYTSGSTIPAVVVPWSPIGLDIITLTQSRVPDTVQFRFNSYNGVPTTNSQSVALFYVGTGSATQFGVELQNFSSTALSDSPLADTTWSFSNTDYPACTGSGITGSAISGSEYHDYAYMRLWLSGSAGYKTSSYLYLPFYDKKLFWNVYVSRETSSLVNQSGSDNRYWIHAESALYNAEGISTRGYSKSASIVISGAATNLVSASYNFAWNKCLSGSIGSSSLISSSSVSSQIEADVNSYIGGLTSSFAGAYFLSTSLNVTTSYLSGAIMPSNSYAINYFSASVTYSGFSGSFTYIQSVFDLTPGGLFAGYLGGSTGSSVIAKAPYDGMFQEFRYWKGMLTDEARKQHTYSATSIRGINETASFFDCIFRLKLEKDESSASFYFSNNFSFPNYTLNDKQSAFTSLPSIHPAITGAFSLQLAETQTPTIVKGVPAFYLFSESGSPNIINGGVYTSSIFATQYTSFTSYDLVTTPRAGAYQKVNDKVFTPTQNTITGSILSPYTSIEIVDSTVSKNSKNVEVAFSPADQTDNDIADQLGSFDLDNYIGAPSDLYSSSYQDLSTLRDFYFQKYVGTYNVWDLVRAIKFYDNSLFKMIKDFVPAKATLSTGIVIKPHILERSKVARNEPILTFHQYSGNIDTAFVSGSNGLGQSYITDFTQSIAGLTGSVTQIVTDNAALYTGRFGGTTITQSRDFNQSMEIKLSNTTTTQSYYTGSLDYLYNNVSQSRKSNLQFDLDYSYRADVPVNLDLIEDYYLTQSAGVSGTSSYWPWATVQDSDYTKLSFTLPRYFGSKNSSSLFNTYSVSDDTIEDIYNAYGKSSPINSYTTKIGLFTQVFTSSFFFQRNDTSLIYLVDESGSFLELNKDNKNWEELQNTFKLGTNATIKLFDNQKYSNQKLTDGSKPIYNSGYSYYPLVYFNQGNNLDNKLYFTATDTAIPKVFSAQNLGSPNFNITGTVNPNYKPTGSQNEIYNIFDNVTLNQENTYTKGDTSSFTYPKYTVPENGTYKFTSSLVLTAEMSQVGTSVSYIYSIVSGSTVIAHDTQSATYEGPSIPIGNSRYFVANAVSNFTAFTQSLDQPLKIKNSSNVTIQTIPSGSILYIAAGSLTGGTGTLSKDTQILYAATPQYTHSLLSNPFTSQSVNITGAFGNSNSVTIRSITSASVWAVGGGFFGTGSFTSLLDLGGPTASLTFNLATPNIIMKEGDEVSFRLKQDNSTSGSYKVYIANPGNLGVISSAQIVGLYPYADQTSGPYIESLDQSTFVINESLSNYYNYQFLPGFSTGSYSGSVFFGNQSSSLYNLYGDVDFPFNLKVNDVLIVKSGSFYQEFDIIEVPTLNSQNKYEVKVSPDINDIFQNNAPQTASFLSKQRDESNMMFTFPKKAGATSFGLVIPDNLSPEMLSNIDTITKEIQQKLIDMGAPKTELPEPTPLPTPTPTMTPTPTPTPTAVPPNPLIIVN